MKRFVDLVLGIWLMVAVEFQLGWGYSCDPKIVGRYNGLESVHDVAMQGDYA